MATMEMVDLAATTEEESENPGSADLTDPSSSLSSITSSLTHDTSRARFHVQDLSYFATCLESSANRAFPTRGRARSRYNSVQVLLLMWQEDELGVENELDGLHQAFTKYGFDTETWSIPSDNPHLKLMIKAASFVEKYESEDCLLIVYYGGHAAINSARQSSWYCKGGPDAALISLDWSAIQTVFEGSTSDVVLLLDCCAAASAAPSSGRAITETIAACGWETIAPVPGRWSFTSALIEVLDEWLDHSFSVAMLHSKVLSTLKHEQPERRGQKKRKVECRRTPVYILTSAEPGTPSINLSRLLPRESRGGFPMFGVPAGCEGDFLAETQNSPNIPDTYSLDGLTSSVPTGDLKVPHVLISLALYEDQEFDLKTCSVWLASFPAFAKYAKVKGVYRSHSTLIIASVPVVIWNLLPESPACSFIGYVTSDNLLDHNVGPKYSGPVETDSSSVTVVGSSHTGDQVAHFGIADSLWPPESPSARNKLFSSVHRRKHLGSPLNDVGAGEVDTSLPKACKNCLTRTTPFWRQDLEGYPLCNKCGLFLKLNGCARPLPRGSQIIKKRKQQEELGTKPHFQRRRGISDPDDLHSKYQGRGSGLPEYTFTLPVMPLDRFVSDGVPNPSVSFPDEDDWRRNTIKPEIRKQMDDFDVAFAEGGGSVSMM